MRDSEIHPWPAITVYYVNLRIIKRFLALYLQFIKIHQQRYYADAMVGSSSCFDKLYYARMCAKLMISNIAYRMCENFTKNDSLYVSCEI